LEEDRIPLVVGVQRSWCTSPQLLEPCPDDEDIGTGRPRVAGRVDALLDHLVVRAHVDGDAAAGIGEGHTEVGDQPVNCERAQEPDAPIGLVAAVLQQLPPLPDLSAHSAGVRSPMSWRIMPTDVAFAISSAENLTPKASSTEMSISSCAMLCHAGSDPAPVLSVTGCSMLKISPTSVSRRSSGIGVPLPAHRLASVPRRSRGPPCREQHLSAGRAST